MKMTLLVFCFWPLSTSCSTGVEQPGKLGCRASLVKARPGAAPAQCPLASLSATSLLLNKCIVVEPRGVFSSQL